MNKLTNKLINIEKYREFLEKSGLSKEEIEIKIQNGDMNSMSDFLQEDLNEKNFNIDTEISLNKDSAFLKLKKTFMPLFFKDYSMVKKEKGSFLKRTMVNGIVSDEVLNHPKYNSFMNSLYSLAKKLGLNISSVQKKLNTSDFKVETLMEVEGNPNKIYTFNKELEKVAQDNELESANLSGKTSNSNNLNNKVNTHSVKDLYQKEFGYVLTTNDIIFPEIQGTPLSNQFSFINNNLLKNLKASLISEMKISDKLLSEVKNNNVNKLLDKYLSEIGTGNSQFSKDQILNNLKNNIDIPDSPSKSLLVNNKVTILNSIEDLQNRVDKNLEKISHLIEVMNILPKKVSQIPEKEVSLLLRNSRIKFVNNLHNMSLPNGESFLEVSNKYFKKKGQLVTADDGLLIHSSQIDSLKTVSENINQKSLNIIKMVEKYIQEMKEQTPIVEEYLKEFVSLTNKYMTIKNTNSEDVLTKEELYRLKFLKKEIDILEIKKYNFNNDLYEQKLQLQETISKIKRVIKSDKDLSASEFKKVKEYNERICGGLSLASRNIVTKGFSTFEEPIAFQIRQNTGLLQREVDMFKVEVKKVELLINDNFIYHKSILEEKRESFKNTSTVVDFVSSYESVTEGLRKFKEKTFDFLNEQKEMKALLQGELNKEDVDFDTLKGLQEKYNNYEKNYDDYYKRFLKENRFNIEKMTMLLGVNHGLQDSLTKLSTRVNPTIKVIAKEDDMIGRLEMILESQVLPDVKQTKSNEELNSLLTTLNQKVENGKNDIKKIEKEEDDIFNFENTSTTSKIINSQFEAIPEPKKDFKTSGLFGSTGNLGGIEEKLKTIEDKELETKSVNSSKNKI